MIRNALASILILAGVIGLVAGLCFLSYEGYRYFAPKYAAVDNKVFHETQQYNEGMIRDLEDIKVQYIQAKPEQKEALRAIALHRFYVYPKEKMPSDLLEFFTKLEEGN